MPWKIFALLLVLLLILLLVGVVVPWVQAQRAQSLGQFSQASHLLGQVAEHIPLPSLWEQAGLLAYRAQEYPRAILLLENARARGVLTLEGWDTLGLAYWQDHQPDRALTRWHEALRGLGPSARLFARLALAYRHLEDWQNERQALQEWVRLKSDDAYPHYRLGLLLLSQDLVQADAEFALAASLDPRLGSAVEALRAALNQARQAPDETERLLLLGRALGMVEEWKLALLLFEQAVSRAPENGEAWAWLAEARQHTGQPLQDELERAHRLAPRSATVHLLSGLFAFRNGENIRAIREFLQAAELQPQESAIWVALGEAYAQQGELSLAMVAYQRATQLAPERADVWRALATFCATYGVQVQEIGLPAARQAVILQPNDARNLDVLGWLLLLNGDLNSAERMLSQALDLQPDLASVHLHLGMLYLYKGQNTQAESHLNEVLNLAPQSPLAEMARRMLGKP